MAAGVLKSDLQESTWTTNSSDYKKKKDLPKLKKE